MKIILKCLILQSILFISNSQFAQVGIGTITPEASSALDITSDNKGLLMPRLTTAQRDLISNPATGLMIYNTTSNDGQLNIGTPSNPVWTGVKGSGAPKAYAATEGDNTSTTSVDYAPVAGMTVSPSPGTYMATFNAELTSASTTVTTFDSDIAIADLNNLYDELMAFPGGEPHALVFGPLGETLPPGVYDVAGAISIAGTLTLAGGTDIPNPVFIIRGPGAFTTAIGATVILTGNAKTENIFWVSGAAMSTAANTTMKGTMLGGGVGAGAMSLGADSDLAGRLLTKLGAVTRGANDIITSPTADSPVNLGLFSIFAMWSSSGAVSDVATATTSGDVGSGFGAVTMTGTHNGEVYPAGTEGGDVINKSTTTYSIYIDGAEVASSSRTIKQENTIVSLQTIVNVSAANNPVTIQWKVDAGEATLKNRTLTLISIEF